MSKKEEFLNTLKGYESQQNWLKRIFEHVAQQRLEGRRSWSHMLLFRLYLISDTMLRLCDVEIRNDTEMCVLDIASFGAVARTLIETFVLFSHISDPQASEEQWRLRCTLLELHDTTTRYRLLKAIGDKETEEAKYLRGRMVALKRSIACNPVIRALDPKRQEKLQEGTVLYLNGLRDAVRDAGIDCDHFDAMYNLLSSLAHSQPSSFHRSREDFEPVLMSDHSYVLADAVFQFVTGVLDLMCRRTFEIYPEVFLKDVPKH